MKRQFSNFNLTMLNLWMGLCRGDVGLPNNIRRLGYKYIWIEYQFQNSAGETVKPELIIASDRVSHTILLEWKSGTNTDIDQLERYSRVDPSDLVTKAMVKPLSVSSQDTCVVGLNKNIDRLRIGIKNGNFSFPLISVDDDGLSLAENQFSIKQVTRVFSPKLLVDFSKIPISLIPFDQNSKPWEIAETVIPQIIAYMSKGEAHFTLEQLLNDLAPVVKNILAPTYHHDLSKLVKRIVDAACVLEFKEFIVPIRKSVRKANSPTWEILYNPMKLPFDKRTSEYKKLQRLQVQFIKALRTGKRDAIQMTLDELIQKQ